MGMKIDKNLNGDPGLNWKLVEFCLTCYTMVNMVNKDERLGIYYAL